MFDRGREVWERFDRINRFGAGWDFLEEDALWFETKDEIRKKLRWGREKERLLAWVRMEMVIVLDPRARECLERHCFRGETLREIAAALRMHLSSVYRAVWRAIRTLRRHAEAQGGARGILAQYRRGALTPDPDSAATPRHAEAPARKTRRRTQRTVPPRGRSRHGRGRPSRALRAAHRPRARVAREISK